MTSAIETVFWAAFLLIVHSYLIYPISLMLLSLIGKRYSLGIGASRKTRKVSVLISAYNEERTIRRRVSELLSMDYPSFEVIVGIDGATDQTRKVLGRISDERLRVVSFEVNRGKVWVLNDLSKLAGGDILMFSDANTRLDKNSLKMLERHFDDEKIGGVCGHLKLLPKSGERTSGLESEYWGIESRIKKLEGDRGMTLGANGAIYAIRRELFVPFHTESRIADDFILPLRIIERGYYFVYEPGALAYESSGDVKTEYVRKIRIGAAITATLKASMPLMNPLRGFIAYSFWSHKIIRWLVPYFLVIMMIANVLLLPLGGVYHFAAVVQTIFYSLAAIGIIGLLLDIQVPALSFLGYFVVANAALLVGMAKSLVRQQGTKWEVSRD